MKSKLIAALALGACAAGLSAPAEAAAVWWSLKDITFDDGGAATDPGSYFDITVYGYGGPSHVVTTTGTTLTGFTYGRDSNLPVSLDTADRTVTFYNWNYSEQLKLVFRDSLLTPEAVNPVVAASSSYECAAYVCPGSGSNTRYVISGYAAAPEAPTWAMMILGAGLLGLGGSALRGRAHARAV